MRRAVVPRVCQALIHRDCVSWLVLPAPPAAAPPAATPAAAAPSTATATATTTTTALGLRHAFRWDRSRVRLAALEPNLRLHVLGHAGRVVDELGWHVGELGQPGAQVVALLVVVLALLEDVELVYTPACTCAHIF